MLKETGGSLMHTGSITTQAGRAVRKAAFATLFGLVLVFGIMLLERYVFQWSMEIAPDPIKELQLYQDRAGWLAALLCILGIIGGIIVWGSVRRDLRAAEASAHEAEVEFRQLAMSDPLTGLPNRGWFLGALDAALEREQRAGMVAVLMVDLDRFKPINDRHGHQLGDRVLKEISTRLLAVLPKNQTAARYGGDEFIIMLELLDDAGSPMAVAQKLAKSISAPMQFEGLTLQLGASIGLTVSDVESRTTTQLIHRADMALYRAKRQGRGSVCGYDAYLDIETDARTRLEDDLRKGIRDGEIIPYFQPLIDLATGDVSGFEVLSRWQSPVRGLMSPASFIPIADSAGLMGDLTIALLKQACLAAQVLPVHQTIAINISPQQLQDEQLPAKLLAVLIACQFPPERLEIEITEDGLVTDINAATRALLALKDLGVTVALDDFGTGYSSLSHLCELPIDKIKIDRSFVHSMQLGSDGLTVINAIAGLGRSLNKITVAEGIETAAEANILRSFGYTQGQGYFYSRPVPPTELEALYARLSSGRLAA